MEACFQSSVTRTSRPASVPCLLEEDGTLLAMGILAPCAVKPNGKAEIPVGDFCLVILTVRSEVKGDRFALHLGGMS